ncbi:O-acetylhomoserine aminocarboxypropyltransferase/cysteine synthase family protein [Leifsonia shinshuensis]|uniref:O-acetylhomoserine (Thiol)-lyase n=1 Tax=Leifsonia shinshuensis TaxID=150026 RepID=A0A853CU28_9MICO|nr:O-acetylhomoserine aminocarboxypropyltransferase/cysteine synthase family protein [Leifsonia shinshuensis]NYJ22694.1 O-acetylhomoserine (thiol)-lyase [Leifsonia shinshuensis]
MPEFTTAQVHAGETREAAHGARVTPIYLTAGFEFDSFANAEERFGGDVPGYTYSRSGNPTAASLERRVAALEGGREAIAVGSGQAALTVALLGLVQSGDHLLSAQSVYSGTRGLFETGLKRLGVQVEFVDGPGDPEEWRRRIRPNTRALFGESIGNPGNDVLDIAAVADVAHQNGLPLIVDNTLATPYLLQPGEHGADIVVHSASKFLGGHGSALGGVVVDQGSYDWGVSPFEHLRAPDDWLHGDSYVGAYGRGAYIAFARSVVASLFGPVLSPVNAFLIQQGIETLSLRLRQQSDTALAVARWLERKPEVASVDYAGLESHPSHDLARRYLPRGAGAILGFTLVGGAAAAQRFYDAVTLFSRMTHIGDVRSLILHPATTTHAHLQRDVREATGIGDGLLRLSIGLEDPTDLIADLERGIAAVTGQAGVAATTATTPNREPRLVVAAGN